MRRVPAIVAAIASALVLVACGEREAASVEDAYGRAEAAVAAGDLRLIRIQPQDRGTSGDTLDLLAERYGIDFVAPGSLAGNDEAIAVYNDRVLRAIYRQHGAGVHALAADAVYGSDRLSAVDRPGRTTRR